MDDDKLTLDLLLDSLCAQDRDIIVLWYIEGYNLNEVAKIIRKNINPSQLCVWILGKLEEESTRF